MPLKGARSLTWGIGDSYAPAEVTNGPAAMLIRLDDPTLADDLCAHFRRSGFTADRAGGSMIEVTRPDAPTEFHAEREVLTHLHIWRLINPGQAVEPVP